MKGSAEGPFKTSSSKRLQEPFENRREGVEINDALGFPAQEMKVLTQGAWLAVPYHVQIPKGPQDQNFKGEAFLLTVGAFLLTVKLLRLKSLKALIRRTFPL